MWKYHYWWFFYMKESLLTTFLSRKDNRYNKIVFDNFSIRNYIRWWPFYTNRISLMAFCTKRSSLMTSYKKNHVWWLFILRITADNFSRRKYEWIFVDEFSMRKGHRWRLSIRNYLLLIITIRIDHPSLIIFLWKYDI